HQSAWRIHRLQHRIELGQQLSAELPLFLLRLSRSRSRLCRLVLGFLLRCLRLCSRLRLLCRQSGSLHRPRRRRFLLRRQLRFTQCRLLLLLRQFFCRRALLGRGLIRRRLLLRRNLFLRRSPHRDRARVFRLLRRIPCRRYRGILLLAGQILFHLRRRLAGPRPCIGSVLRRPFHLRDAQRIARFVNRQRNLGVDGERREVRSAVGSTAQQSRRHRGRRSLRICARHILQNHHFTRRRDRKIRLRRNNHGKVRQPGRHIQLA